MNKKEAIEIIKEAVKGNARKEDFFKTPDEIIGEVLDEYISSNEVMNSISLLKKYMSHVMNNESVSFVENANDAFSIIKFTDNELEKLKTISQEIINDY